MSSKLKAIPRDSTLHDAGGIEPVAMGERIPGPVIPMEVSRP